MAREMGLVRFGTLSLDGTKVRAKASKRKAMSYERMLKEQARLDPSADTAARPYVHFNAAPGVFDKVVVKRDRTRLEQQYQRGPSELKIPLLLSPVDRSGSVGLNDASDGKPANLEVRDLSEMP